MTTTRRVHLPPMIHASLCRKKCDEPHQTQNDQQKNASYCSKTTQKNLLIYCNCCPWSFLLITYSPTSYSLILSRVQIPSPRHLCGSVILLQPGHRGLETSDRVSCHAHTMVTYQLTLQFLHDKSIENAYLYICGPNLNVVKCVDCPATILGHFITSTCHENKGLLCWAQLNPSSLAQQQRTAVLKQYKMAQQA